MIPKKIHYCWFGGAPLPEEAVRCIESWKKYCPDCEIIEWNEKNYDFSACEYAKEAYENGKWAFVSDYARFDILFRCGGIYFDTDVELIRPIGDILEKGGFMGIEDTRGNVASGLGLALEKGDALAGEIVEAYKKRHFSQKSGTIDQTTVVEFVTGILTEKGYRTENRLQRVAGITVYPAEYFCPLDHDTGVLTVTENTRSIHHFTATWKSESELSWQRFCRRVHTRLGQKSADRLLESAPVRLIGALKRDGFAGTARKLVRRIRSR